MADQKPQGPPTPTRSEADEQILHYLALLATFLQPQPNSPPPKERKTFGDALREPAVVAALVTVLIGGIAATVITGIIQRQAGDRQFYQTLLKARGDQALISYKDYLDQEQQFMRRTYALIGTYITACERLKDLTKSTWRQQFAGSEEVIERQMRDIRTHYNEVQAKWNGEVEELGLLMGYYHPNQPHVVSSWKAVKEGVKAYQRCTYNWYDIHHASNPPATDEEVSAACNRIMKPCSTALTT